ncbi:MAG: capsule assembly Wzi family protein [Gammaproteobacteria bacterium]|nr:capsule assembly Wzi family protein [Gammaproteobacteria bacterium]
MNKRTHLPLPLLLLVLLSVTPATATPLISPGDIALRHDIQRLADYGIITGPVSTWPLAWGPVMADIGDIERLEQLPRDVIDAIHRVQARANRATRIDEVSFNASASVAGKPTRLRSFENTPRESAELGAGISYTGDWFAISLNGQVVDSPSDGQNYRADGSMIGVVLGNYSFTANTLERWWGPGWDGSLILSSNARPIPALSIDRNFTDAFKTKWLNWLGPWDFSLHFGQMENDREIPNARFFGMRINFKPIPSLEIGLSRTAQWCGSGRPCGFDTFVDLLLGRDNRGDGGTTRANEPGNQLAGVDIRWATRLLSVPVAFYSQLIGEDEAGGYPSRYLGQFGLESTGTMGERWSYRWFGEFAATSCRFWKSDEIFNCAYNHSIYRTGYRYRGRSVGHNADNDSRVATTGLMLVSDDEAQWLALLRFGKLNRGGSADAGNSLTPTPQEIASIDLTHTRLFRYGQVRIGLGVERVDDIASGQTSSDTRAFLEWRSH